VVQQHRHSRTVLLKMFGWLRGRCRRRALSAQEDSKAGLQPKPVTTLFHTERIAATSKQRGEIMSRHQMRLASEG
jgi:hypothetical protein